MGSKAVRMGGRKVKLIAGGIACSKYKELVGKVHTALKIAIKKAQADTTHGMPLLSELLPAFEEEQEAFKISLSRGMPRVVSLMACLC